MRKYFVLPVWTGFSFVDVAIPMVVLLMALQVAFALPANKQQIKRQKAIFNTQIAKEQISRGLYREAEAILLFTISDCGPYLKPGKRTALDNLLSEARSGSLSRRKIPDQRRKSVPVSGSSPQIRAQDFFRSTRDPNPKPVTDTELISRDTQIYAKQMGRLFAESVQQYDAGLFEQARHGFSQVVFSGVSVQGRQGRSSRDYIRVIDKAMLDVPTQPLRPVTPGRSPITGTEADKIAEILGRIKSEQKAARGIQPEPSFTLPVDAASMQPQAQIGEIYKQPQPQETYEPRQPDFSLLQTPAPETVANIDSSINSLAQKYDSFKMQVQALLAESVEYYEKGDYDQARAGFNEVARSGVTAAVNGRSAAEYLALVDRSVEYQKKFNNVVIQATGQYRQGLYFQAKTQLDNAKQQYAAYLSDGDNRQLDSMLLQVNEAAAERIRIARHLDTSSRFRAQGNLLEAKRNLEQVKDSAFLSKEERRLVIAAITELENAMPTSRPTLPLTPAMDTKTDQSNTPASSSRIGHIPFANKVAPPLVIDRDMDSSPQENPYLRQVEAKRNRIKSFVAAVVADAKQNASEALSKGDFQTAKSVLVAAFATIKTHQMVLGTETYNAYNATLESIAEQVDQAESKHLGQQRIETEEQSRQMAIELKANVQNQRKQAITDYLDGAVSFQLEHKYEEALGQVERVLQIDPFNKKALSMQNVLEDTIRWREIIDINKKTNKEEMDMLIAAEEKDRPYRNEITYLGAYDIDPARNWKDLTDGREKDQWAGRDPADEKVYEQLEQKVDLSAFSEDMLFYEAIDILQNSVEPPLTLTVRWKDLSENAFIEKEEPIGLSFGSGATSVSLKTGLEHLLQAVGGGLAEIDYMVSDGMVTVATKDTLPSNIIMETYDVAELVSEPMMSGGMMGGGMMGGGMMGGGMMGGGGGMMGGRGGGGSYGGGGGSYGGGGMMGGGMMGGGMMGGGGGMMGGGGYGGGGGMMGGRGGMMGGGGGMMGGRGGNKIYELIYNIREIEPESWGADTNNNRTGQSSLTSTSSEDITTGKGRIRQFGQTRLIVWQTPEVHEQIRDLIERMSDLSDNQVSIEARFIVVGEHFLEDVGLRTNITRLKIGGSFDDFISISQAGSYEFAQPTSTAVPGSIGSISSTSPAVSFGLSYGDSTLDDLAVDFLIRATKAHANARTLTAPKLTVISGESANIMVNTSRDYISNATMTSDTAVTGAGSEAIVTYLEHEIDSADSGITMMIIPTITSDKKYVILSITTNLQDVQFASGLTNTTVAVVDGEAIRLNFEVPSIESTNITTRVIVPDKGTILLGGLTLSALQEREMGIPILSQIPILGRLFSNRSEVKDKQVLLVLVRPTIILKDEAEADAIAALSEEVPSY